jgi:hypothetical protein
VIGPAGARLIVAMGASMWAHCGFVRRAIGLAAVGASHLRSSGNRDAGSKEGRPEYRRRRL